MSTSLSALGAGATDTWQTHFERCMSMMEHNREREALPHIEAAIKQKPNMALLYVARAHNKIFLNDDKGAIEDCNKALKLDPNFYGAYSRRGFCLCRLGQYEKGIKDFDIALAHPHLDFDRWDDNMDYGNRFKAYKHLGRAAEVNRDARLVQILNQVKVAMDARAQLDLHNALSMMDKIVAALPDDLSAHYYRGVCALNDSNNEKALQDFNFVIRTLPNYPPGYYFRAEAYSKASKLQNAIDDYTKLIQMNPDIVACSETAETGRCKSGSSGYDEGLVLVSDVYMLRADAYRRQHKSDLAVKDMLKATSMNPGDVQGLLELAAYFVDLGKMNEALDRCKQAIAVNPKSPESYQTRATVYDRMGQFPQAIADCSKALQLSPGESDWYLTRAALYRKNKQFDKAIDDYTHVIDGAPSEDDAYISRADSYCKLGKYDKAIADYTKALSLDPVGNGGLYALRAQAYEKTGRNDLAEKDRKEAAKQTKTTSKTLDSTASPKH